MLGGIYAHGQRCFVCGGPFKHFEPRGLWCPDHPEVHPKYYRVFLKHKGTVTTRQFKSYRQAWKFLSYLRQQIDDNKFDARDYMQSQPLGFENQADRWLQIKKGEVKSGTFKNLRRYMHLAAEAWGNRNVKDIGFADIQDFLMELECSSKTKANLRSALHAFWKWLEDRDVLKPHQVPRIPSVRFELGYRRTVAKPIQQAILEEVKRISWDRDPKIWLGIRWLTIYVALRPGDLLRLTEEDVNTDEGYLRILRPTKSAKPKYVPLLPDDRSFVVQILEADKMHPMPSLPFFRHKTGHGGITKGSPYGPKFFSIWWKRACENLGVEGVDLYGGTRHSTVAKLGEKWSPEDIKTATMHQTNKAFERYFRPQKNRIVNIYEDAAEETKAADVVPFKKKDV